MRDSLSLFYRLALLSIRSKLQNRASFLMLTCSHMLGTALDLVGLWVLFDRFHLIAGWTMQELMLIYGIVNMGFSTAEVCARGFDSFGQMLKMGDFDRVLARPASALLQIASYEIQIMRVGRFFIGAGALTWGMYTLSLSPFSAQGLILCSAYAGTTCLFYSLFLMQGALCFWTTEVLELMNITTYGGVETGQYPLSIYKKSFQLIFTCVIPLGCVTYYPIASALQQEPIPLWIGLLAPASSLLFLLAALALWKRGLRRYHSAG